MYLEFVKRYDEIIKFVTFWKFRNKIHRKKRE